MMDTKIFTKATLDDAALLLKEGEVVAFPTETVYGLGAIATSQKAVLKVFEAKGRPSDNPLIVHVHDVQQVVETVEDFPKEAQLLAKAFWPGPLTMILKARKNQYAPAVSAGLPTVAFRMPNHELTLSLIEKVGIPLVGPSANRSTRPSPTRVNHVIEDMDQRIAGVIDGGDTKWGVESTVIDLTDARGAVILRPGVITSQEIEKVIGPLMENTYRENEMKEIPKAPGMKYRHYAPNTPVVLVDGSTSFWKQIIRDYHTQHQKVGVMATSEKIASLKELDIVLYCLGDEKEVKEMNYHLFHALRTLDHSDVDVILAQSASEEGVGLAYMNRLKKASSISIKEN